MENSARSLGVLILAAGKGTRMCSDKPKVLQPLLEEPVVFYPLKAVRDAGLGNVAVLVGHQGEMVESYIERAWPGIEVVWQREQLGTGHAVGSARDWWKHFDSVLVLSGDVPLVRPETLAHLVEKHTDDTQCSFMSFVVENPDGYGRVVRLADGGVRIVEHKDALDEELLIQEINAGIYIFNTEALSKVIDRLSCNNEQHEYYLTDTIPLIGETEGTVNVVICEGDAELLGVNNPHDLAVTAGLLRDRIIDEQMQKGLKCIDPKSTWIGPRVEIEPDVFLEPGVRIWGASRIGSCARIGAYSSLRNVEIGPGSVIHGPSVVCDSTVGGGVEVGPFAYLRNHTEMKDRSKAGRFVEIKNSVVGEGSKVPHLSYIGDAHVGTETNIGAGTITCNYDGRDKHRTEIGSGCFVGSDTMFVAPVKMGDNATTAAGSVVSVDVPDGALAIARSRQTNIADWHVRKNLPGKPGAKSAEES